MLTQWFKNGDHPADDSVPVRRRGRFDSWSPDVRDHTGELALIDGQPFLCEGRVVRYFRRPGVDGEAACPECSVRFHDHGWLDFPPDGQTVCPGDWIEDDGNGNYRVAKEEVGAKEKVS